MKTFIKILILSFLISCSSTIKEHDSELKGTWQIYDVKWSLDGGMNYVDNACNTEWYFNSKLDLCQLNDVITFNNNEISYTFHTSKQQTDICESYTSIMKYSLTGNTINLEDDHLTYSIENNQLFIFYDSDNRCLTKLMYNKLK